MRVPAVRTFLYVVAAVVTAALPSAVLADEADNFTCRARTLTEALPALDALMNARIADAIVRANARHSGCDRDCVLAELRRDIGASDVQLPTFIPKSRFGRWLARLDLDRCHLAFRDTIYGARNYHYPWLYPFNGRIIFVVDSIRLAGRTIGLDKMDHFIREGLEHWRRVHERQMTIDASMAAELGPARRQFAWTEWGLKGMSLTGVLAYADLAAGYAGFRFWNDLLSIDAPGSYVARDAATGRVRQQRPFTFATYVNDAWDESINCSTFDEKLAPEVAAALRLRSMACPAVPRPTFATLPDARLYVNPAFLDRLGEGTAPAGVAPATMSHGAS